jgi:nitroreductase
METLEAIRKRCSLKTHLSRRAIEPETINMILDAGHLAPSAFVLLLLRRWRIRLRLLTMKRLRKD